MFRPRCSLGSCRSTIELRPQFQSLSPCVQYGWHTSGINDPRQHGRGNCFDRRQTSTPSRRSKERGDRQSPFKLLGFLFQVTFTAGATAETVHGVPVFVPLPMFDGDDTEAERPATSPAAQSHYAPLIELSARVNQTVSSPAGSIPKGVRTATTWNGTMSSIPSGVLMVLWDFPR